MLVEPSVEGTYCNMLLSKECTCTWLLSIGHESKWVTVSVGLLKRL